MKYVVCLPFRVKMFRDKFIETCKLENVLEIDNTENNIGVMASHNLGIKELYKNDAEWLIIASAAIRFGKHGGLDFIEYLQNTKADIVEATGVYGWHLIAFRKNVIDAVGEWDENFTPYGYDDIDYSIRIQKTIKDLVWEKVLFDVRDTVMGHSIKYGGVRSDDNRLHQYFYNKWGIYPGEGTLAECYDTPFNIPGASIKYCPKYNDENHVSKIQKVRYEND